MYCDSRWWMTYFWYVMYSDECWYIEKAHQFIHQNQWLFGNENQDIPYLEHSPLQEYFDALSSQEYFDALSSPEQEYFDALCFPEQDDRCFDVYIPRNASTASLQFFQHDT